MSPWGRPAATRFRAYSRSMVRERLWASAYLFVQTLAVFAWWVWLRIDWEAHGYFIGPLLPDGALQAYLLPDVALYGVVGLTTSVLLHRDHPYAWPSLLLLTGGILYATLATAGLFFESGGRWISILSMAASFAGTAFFAWRLRPRS